MPDHRIYPHGLPTALTSNVWQVKGALPIPLPRNMTVVRLKSGGLLLYSVVAMDEAGMAALEALGKPEYMVVPMPAHTMDAPFYKARYPDLKVIAAADTRDVLQSRVNVDAGPEALAELGIGYHLSVGLKWTEIILDVPVEGGRALVFADVFTVTPKTAPLILRALGAPGGMGMPRIVKFRQLKQKAATRTLLQTLSQTPALAMVLCSHGPAVTQQPSNALMHAAAGL